MNLPDKFVVIVHNEEEVIAAQKRLIELGYYHPHWSVISLDGLARVVPIAIAVGDRSNSKHYFFERLLDTGHLPVVSLSDLLRVSTCEHEALEFGGVRSWCTKCNASAVWNRDEHQWEWLG